MGRYILEGLIVVLLILWILLAILALINSLSIARIEDRLDEKDDFQCVMNNVKRVQAELEQVDRKLERQMINSEEQLRSLIRAEEQMKRYWEG